MNGARYATGLLVAVAAAAAVAVGAASVGGGSAATATRTVTVTATVTATATTTATVTSTVTAPASTVTVTETVPGPTTTVTETAPGPTVTVTETAPGSTATVTETATVTATPVATTATTTPPAPIVSPSPWLPFDLAADTAATGVPVYPVSVISYSPGDPKYAYANSHWLPNPPGTGTMTEGTTSYVAFGGPMRDYFAPADDAATTLAGDQTELGWYQKAGLSALVSDNFTLAGTNRDTELKTQMQAAINIGSKIILQPDGTTSATGYGGDTAANATNLANYHLSLPNRSALQQDAAGKYLVMPFKPESWSAATWQTYATAMSNGGMPVRLVFCMLNLNSGSGLAAYSAAGVHDYAVWGTSDAVSAQNTIGNLAAVHNAGGKYYQFIRYQDDRPRENKTSGEAGGFDLLLKCRDLTAGTDGAIIVTTNDFNEGTAVTKTMHNGYALLDLMSYLATYAKNGPPAVARDGVYVAHRVQTFGYHGTQANTVTLAGSAPYVDEVSALVFATAPSTVTVTSGGVDTVVNVSSGVTQVKAPLRPGQVSVSVTRSGAQVAAVTSPHTVSDTGIKDMQYRVTSSFASVPR